MGTKIGWSWFQFHNAIRSLIGTAGDYVENNFDGLLSAKVSPITTHQAEKEVLSYKLHIRKESKVIWSLATRDTSHDMKIAFAQNASVILWKKILQKALCTLESSTSIYIPYELQKVVLKASIREIPPLGMSLWVAEEIISLTLCAVTSQNTTWGAVADVMVETKNETDQAMKKPGILKQRAGPDIPGKALRILSRGGTGASEVQLEPEMRFRIDNLLPMQYSHENTNIFRNILKDSLNPRKIDDNVLDTLLNQVDWLSDAQNLAKTVNCNVEVSLYTCFTFSVEMLDWYNSVYETVTTTLKRKNLKAKRPKIQKEREGCRQDFLRRLCDAFAKGRNSKFWHSCEDKSACTMLCTCQCYTQFQDTTLKEISEIFDEERLLPLKEDVLETAELFLSLDPDIIVKQLSVGPDWHQARINYWNKQETIRAITLENSKYNSKVKGKQEYTLASEIQEDIKEKRCPFDKECKGKLTSIMLQLRSADEASVEFVQCTGCKRRKMV